MSSGDSTGASISELERRRLRKAEIRASHKYKAIADDEKNEFTPKDVTAWVGDREGGKMMKLTQHTDVQDIMVYGKRVSQRGFIASIKEENTAGFTDYVFIDVARTWRVVVGWQGVSPNQVRVTALTDFVTFDGECQSYIYIEDHRAKKGWWSVHDCAFVTFDPGVTKPLPQNSWKHDVWPVMKSGEMTLKKGGRFENRLSRCWVHTGLEETVHDDGIVTYTCRAGTHNAGEGQEEHVGDLPIYNDAFGLTQRDVLAENLGKDTLKVYSELIRKFPPVNVEDDEGNEIVIRNDPLTYAAWLDVEGEVEWSTMLPTVARHSPNKNLIMEVLSEGFAADVVRLLHQNEEGVATAAAVIRSREQATVQLVSRYKQELDTRNYRGSVSVDELNMLSHAPYVFYHASLNYLRVSF